MNDADQEVPIQMKGHGQGKTSFNDDIKDIVNSTTYSLAANCSAVILFTFVKFPNSTFDSTLTSAKPNPN